MASRWVALTPRDTVLVRDGRPFDAGVDASAEAVLPTPSTVGGALAAAYGREFTWMRGPLSAVRTGQEWTAYLPVPADLATDPDDPGTVRRLAAGPVEDGTVTDLDESAPMRLVGDGEPLAGWLDADQLGDYLHGELVVPGDEVAVEDLDVLAAEDAWPGEDRVGLARADRVVRDGLLYQSRHLRPVDGLALLAECDFGEADAALASAVRLGGHGRVADVSPVGSMAWPSCPDRFPGGRVLLYVATPAIWPDGWRPPLPPGVRLCAAAVPGPMPVATARPDGGRMSGQALRWAVPAGSVYLLEFAADDPVRAEADAAAWTHGTDGTGGVHGTAYGRPSGDRLASAGFGVVLTGVWSVEGAS